MTHQEHSVDGAVVDDQRERDSSPASPVRAAPRPWPPRPCARLRLSAARSAGATLAAGELDAARQIVDSRAAPIAARARLECVGRPDGRLRVAARRRAPRRARGWPALSDRNVPIRSRTKSSSSPTDARSSASPDASRMGSSSLMTLPPPPGIAVGRSAHQGRGKLGRPDRLADVVVHPRREARLAVAGHGVGGHGHDVQLARRATGARMRRVASRPSSSGIWTSIRTTS